MPRTFLKRSWDLQEQKIEMFRNSQRTFPWFACSLNLQEQKSNSDDINSLTAHIA
jgi:hypothetical protein